VTGITLENGDSFTAKVFIDSSYEGDLMAQAASATPMAAKPVPSTRRPSRRARRTPFHQFLVDIPSYDARGKLLPEISRGGHRAGAADNAVQATNFRMCFPMSRKSRSFAAPRATMSGATPCLPACWRRA